MDPALINKNERILIEEYKPFKGKGAKDGDYIVRLYRSRIRGRKLNGVWKEFVFRDGRFTKWPKKWDTEIRETLEKALPDMIESLPVLEVRDRGIDELLVRTLQAHARD